MEWNVTACCISRKRHGRVLLRKRPGTHSMRMRKESGKTLRKIHGGAVYVSIHKHEIQIRSVEGIHCGSSPM